MYPHGELQFFSFFNFCDRFLFLALNGLSAQHPLETAGNNKARYLYPSTMWDCQGRSGERRIRDLGDDDAATGSTFDSSSENFYRVKSLLLFFFNGRHTNYKLGTPSENNARCLRWNFARLEDSLASIKTRMHWTRKQWAWGAVGRPHTAAIRIQLRGVRRRFRIPEPQSANRRTDRAIWWRADSLPKLRSECFFFFFSSVCYTREIQLNRSRKQNAKRNLRINFVNIPFNAVIRQPND